MLNLQQFIKKINDIGIANNLLSRQLRIDIKKIPLKLNALNTDYAYTYRYTDDSIFNNPITPECNNITLDQYGNIICMKFPRPDLITENDLDIVDWKNTFIHKVSKGYLVDIYKYKGSLFIKTEDTIEARQEKNLHPMVLHTVRDILFSKILKNDYDNFFTPAYSFTFKYTPPKFSASCTAQLELIGVFNLITAKEVNFKDTGMYSKVPELYTQYSPIRFEGVDKKSAVDISKSLSFFYSGLLFKNKITNKAVYLSKTIAINPDTQFSMSNTIFVASKVLDHDWSKITVYYPKYKPLVALFRNLILDLQDNYLDIWTKLVIGHDKKGYNAIKTHPLYAIMLLLKKGCVTTFEQALCTTGPYLLLRLTKELRNKEYLEVIKNL